MKERPVRTRRGALVEKVTEVVSEAKVPGPTCGGDRGEAVGDAPVPRDTMS